MDEFFRDDYDSEELDTEDAEIPVRGEKNEISISVSGVPLRLKYIVYGP